MTRRCLALRCRCVLGCRLVSRVTTSDPVYIRCFTSVRREIPGKCEMYDSRGLTLSSKAQITIRLQRKEVIRHDKRVQKSRIPLGVVLGPTRALPHSRHLDLVPQEVPRRLRHKSRLGTMSPQALDEHPHVLVQP